MSRLRSNASGRRRFCTSSCVTLFAMPMSRSVKLALHCAMSVADDAVSGCFIFTTIRPPKSIGSYSSRNASSNSARLRDATALMSLIKFLRFTRDELSIDAPPAWYDGCEETDRSNEAYISLFIRRLSIS